MASETDLTRARLGAKMTLDAQCVDAPSSADRADPGLQSLLGDIRHGRAAQTARLMRWLEQRDTGYSQACEPATTGESAEAENDEQQSTETAIAGSLTAAQPVTRPRSATDGVSVIGRVDVADDLIRFQVPRPLDFKFEAGASVKVGLGGLQRSYSIVSAPHEPTLEFFVELTPGGQMSEQLQHLNVGDQLTLGTAKGGIRLDETGTEHVMLATVTGINPFISLVRDYLHRGLRGHRFHILHGASYQHQFGYDDELAALAAAHPDTVCYTPTVSRPQETANTGWTGQSGRVDAVVEDYLIANALSPDTARIYACGHSAMLDTVTSRYQGAGFTVRTESYD